MKPEKNFLQEDIICTMTSKKEFKKWLAVFLKKVNFIPIFGRFGLPKFEFRSEQKTGRSLYEELYTEHENKIS